MRPELFPGWLLVFYDIPVSALQILDGTCQTSYESYQSSTSVFPEPHFSGGQLTPAFENWGSMQIFEGQLGLTPSS